MIPEETLANDLSDIGAFLASPNAQEIYYVLTTADDEVSIMFPQKWTFGKVLYFSIRYGNVLSIALDIPKNFRNYFDISPMHVPVRIACDGDLSPPTTFYMTPELNVTFDSGYPCASRFQEARINHGPGDLISLWTYTYQGAARGPLQDWGTPTIKPEIQSYFNFGFTAATTIATMSTFIARYRKQNGRFTRVLRRDGGFYFLAAIGTRLANIIAIFVWVHFYVDCDGDPCAWSLFSPYLRGTPSLPEGENPDFAILMLLQFQYVVIPILVQRLVINVRKVDFMGSQPLASTLLFARSTSSGSDPSGVDSEGEGLGYDLNTAQIPDGINQGAVIT
ncbi:hypothetical protein FA13DRAFT_1707645 [Coprinellus micaceus]|uniref:Uncharacterized protein n=1 Tax=Coprinellus micaceus TaxID=71717 RepID=A0A4Y7TJB7_COPMI|nr:hypothetical protein FA13DRAFT_1707645 [Coprinellus micaceus]